jgi:tetratricopeptide (TPR) repeat protein
MKKISNCILLLLLINIAGAFSQSAGLDSLSSLIRSDKQDSNKVKHLNTLGWAIMYSNPDTAIILSSEALTISEKISWPKGIANSYGQLAGYNYLKGDFTKALEYYFKTMAIDEKIGNKMGVASDLASIGLVYSNLKNYDKALHYFFEAMDKMKDLGSPELIASNFNNIAGAYSAKGEYLKSLEYYKKAYEIAERLKNKNGLALTSGNIGNEYKNLNDYNSALEYYLKAYALSEEIGDKYNMIAVASNLGTLFTSMNRLKEAEEYLNKGIVLSKEIGATAYLRDCEANLSALYEQSGEYKKSLEHFKIYSLYKDSIASDENVRRQTRNEMQYEFDKKEAAAEKERALSLAESKRQKIIIIAVVGILFLVLIFSVFIWRSLKISREQKDLIEEKQREILDSIQYARRIQNAMLPKEKYIDRSLRRMNVGG